MTGFSDMQPGQQFSRIVDVIDASLETSHVELKAEAKSKLYSDLEQSWFSKDDSIGWTVGARFVNQLELSGLDPPLSGYEAALFNAGRLSEALRRHALDSDFPWVGEPAVEETMASICPLPPFC